jgi:hypothetical protein
MSRIQKRGFDEFRATDTWHSHFHSGSWKTRGIEQGNGVSLSFLARIFSRNGDSNSGFTAVRMSKNGHHFYTILASDSSFEYVFRNGHDRWSTISPSLARRIIEKNKDAEIGNQIASGRKQFLKLAIGSGGIAGSSWETSKEVNYSTRELAIKTEREILDISWAGKEDELDD